MPSNAAASTPDRETTSKRRAPASIRQLAEDVAEVRELDARCEAAARRVLGE